MDRGPFLLITIGIILRVLLAEKLARLNGPD